MHVSLLSMACKKQEVRSRLNEKCRKLTTSRTVVELLEVGYPRRQPQPTGGAPANRGVAPSRRRRRGGKVWVGGIPLPTGVESGRGSVPLKKILKFYPWKSYIMVFFYELLN